MVQPEEVPRKLVESISQILIGKKEQAKLVVIALLARGHVLIEDIPGVGKTLLGIATARSMGVRFRRIQFTNDTLPSDVIGVNVFNQKTSDFEFKEGPVFTEVLLADEINRTSPRTQSALLEAMGEGQVSVDGVTYVLSEPFFVLSTMNPIERFGSFDLPESQLDRFMMSISLGYPDREHEREILDRNMQHVQAEKMEPATDLRSIKAARKAVTRVKVEPIVTDYLLDLIKATREHPEIRLGLSSRAGLHLKWASQAHALMEGRDYVIPQDLRSMFGAVSLHRILLSSSSENGGARTAKDNLLGKILRSVHAPI